MLVTPKQLLDLPNGHGILPFEYIVEMSDRVQPGTWWPFLGHNESWHRKLAVLDSVNIAYGTSDQIVQLSMWDPESTELPFQYDANTVKIPKNGDYVRVRHRDSENPNLYRTIFKGTIRGIAERISDGGRKYVIEAVTDVRRLNEVHVHFTSNVRNDPISPSPTFTNTGVLSLPVFRTVYELIREIMNFPNAFGDPDYFTFDMIDWQGLDTSKRCGLFIPSDVTLNDGKGKAIEQVLSLAGNYTLLYVPNGWPDGRDKLTIVELNLSCNRCGQQWDLLFPNGTVDEDALPASLYRIESDETRWASQESFNTCRLVMGRVRFYSGHWHIPEMVYGNYAKQIGRDDVTGQTKRAKNFEGAFYRFTDRNGQVDDTRNTSKQYVVGAPLFPDWNVHEDYLPDIIHISSVIFDSSAPKDKNGTELTPDDFKYKAEFDNRILGDVIAAGGLKIGKTANLRVYQAWHAPDDCPACSGTGAVKAVYDGDDNEPILEYWAASPSGQRLLGRSDASTLGSLKDDERLEVKVTNYLMDPHDFGQVDSTGNRLPPSGTLRPYDGTDYPLPWKNLCPYCRGVGKNPQWRIRNIQQDLFSGRNNQVSGGINDPSQIPVDYDATSTGPEIWEQTQSRITFNQTPVVQTEQAWMVELPVKSLLNLKWADMDSQAKALASTLKTNPLRYSMSHPMKFKNLKKLLPMSTNADLSKPGVTVGDFSNAPGGGSAGNYAFYTRVMQASPDFEIDYRLGRVIFRRPMFIPCRRDVVGIRTPHKAGVYFVGSDGMLSQTAKRYLTADPHDRNASGYWRPAKVWMTFYYTKNNKYDDLRNAPTTTLTYHDSEGVERTYNARPMLIDGSLVVDVRRNDANTQSDPIDRPIQMLVQDDSVPVETSEVDFNESPVLPAPQNRVIKMSDMTTVNGLPSVTDHFIIPSELTDEKTARGYAYPSGKIQVFAPLSHGEQARETDGVLDWDNRNVVARVKNFTWTMKDGRVRLLALGIRRLESTTDLKVSGSLTLVGTSNDLSRGLGWVDYPDKGKASVLNVRYDYTRGFTTVLELSRQRARFGELPPSAEQRTNYIVKEIGKLRRDSTLAELARQARVDAAQAAGGDFQGNGLNGPLIGPTR